MDGYPENFNGLAENCRKHLSQFFEVLWCKFCEVKMEEWQGNFRIIREKIAEEFEKIF